MSGYIRQDVTNNIADGNVINASDFDNEYNAIETAFNATTGHTHDGTAAEGAPITKLGPAQDLVVGISSVTPKTDNTLDLGSSALEFKDLWIDGTANIDSLVADTADINAGTIDGVTIGGASAGAATFTTATATTGNITTVNATTVDTTNIEVTTLKAKDGTSAGSIADSTGVVTLASSVLTTTDINGGTVDGVAIGAGTPGTGAFTTLSANSTTTLSSLTASTALALDASKNIVSVTNTGTGNNVLATSPVLTTPNLGTPSTLTLTNATGLPTAGMLDNAVTDAKLRDSAALSVIGRATNTSGDPADIAAGTDHQVLRRSGTAVGFGAVALDQAAAISGTLPVANGGTGITSFGGGVATFLSTPSSANLAAAVTDETGSGALVFGTNPTISGATISTGSINNTPIGASTANTGSFTNLTASGTVSIPDDSISGDKVEGGTINAITINTLTSTTVNTTTVDATNIEVTNIKAKDGTAAGSIADATGVVTLNSSVLTTTDINGGSIDGAVIGGASAAAATVTTLTATQDSSFTSTGALLIPVGTEAQRPTAATGKLRFNTTVAKFEGYNGTSWTSVGGGATGGGSDSIFIENGQTVTTNYSIPSAKNAMSTGPITVNAGITVTVPPGSRWVVL